MNWKRSETFILVTFYLEGKLIGLRVITVIGIRELYLVEEAVVVTVVQAEVQSEISLTQAELVEARGKKNQSS